MYFFPSPSSNSDKSYTKSQFKNLNQFLICLAVFLMVGCGGGGGGGGDTGDARNTVQNTDIFGSVGDGPITGATITLRDANGALIGTTSSDTSAKYQISVPGNTAFPVTIAATGGIDVVTGSAPDFTMVSIALKKADLNSKKRTVNINPFSTIIVQAAREMSGGLTAENIAAAKQTIINKFSFGLNSANVPDPISSDINANNIADIVKSSEALGELVRRTRDAIIASGTQIDGTAVINAIASDFADGKLDGLGSNSNPLVSATAKIASAQVLLEVISNQLHVNDSSAESLMDSAVLLSEPTSTSTINDVSITGTVLSNTIDALRDVRNYAPSTSLDNLITIVSGLSENDSVSAIDAILPADAEQSLELTVMSVPMASSTTLDLINSGTTTVVNIAPVINSTPVVTATEGVTYTYDVNANDGNSNDILTYSLDQGPSGMTIDPNNGLISWTPSSSQIGSQNVSVRITDNGTPELFATQGYTISVSAQETTPVNNAPSIVSNAVLQAQAGTAYSYDVNATDSDAGDILYYSLSQAPAGMIINTDSGQISWTPNNNQIGAHNITVSVADNGDPSMSSIQGFTVTVSEANTAPIINSDPILTASANTAYSYDVEASDNNVSDTLTYSLTEAPSGMTINMSTGNISWTPISSQAGSHSVTVRVTDNGTPSLFATQSFNVTINSVGSLHISSTYPQNYIWDKLENNKYHFVDRDYVFGTNDNNQIPSAYYGLDYLRTAKGDTLSTGDSHISFYVNKPVTIYVAHHDSITTKPTWLSSWTDTGDQLVSRSIYKKDFSAGTITLGGNTQDGLNGTSMYYVFLKPLTEVTDTKILVDGTSGTMTTESNTTTYVKVANSTETINIISQPSNGSILIVDGNILQYTPNTDFSGSDTVTYERVSQNGDTSIESLTISTICSTCVSTVSFDLFWDAGNSTDTGYLIYYGSTAETASTLLKDVTTNSLINPQSPSTIISSDELNNLQTGDNACFRIKAYDSENQASDFSSAVCATI